MPSYEYVMTCFQNGNGQSVPVVHTYEQGPIVVNANGPGPVLDCSACPMSSISMVGRRVGGTANTVAINIEGSIDGVTWVTFTGRPLGSIGGGLSITFFQFGPQYAVVKCGPMKFFRFNVVTIGAGNTIELRLLAARF